MKFDAHNATTKLEGIIGEARVPMVGDRFFKSFHALTVESIDVEWVTVKYNGGNLRSEPLNMVPTSFALPHELPRRYPTPD
jgi:hypothetical protein